MGIALSSSSGENPPFCVSLNRYCAWPHLQVLERQAVKILGSIDFLGNPVGLLSDVASGVQGMIALDVVGLVRDVTHGMSDTTSKVIPFLTVNISFLYLNII